MNEKSKNIGAIWKGTKRNGEEYLYGSITVDDKPVRFVAFVNSYQEGKRPHYHIFPERPRIKSPDDHYDEPEDLPF